MSVQALGTFGVYGRASDREMAVIELADEYRRELVSLTHERHCAMIDLRNRMFPELLPALERMERAKSAIWLLEHEIKQLHSKVRDRNIVTPEQRSGLKRLRAERAEAKKLSDDLKKRWYALEKSFREFFRSLEDWKQVKSLAKRKEKYEAIDWPDELAEYANLWMDYDIRSRELGQRFKERGLHYAIRGEISVASKPKTSKAGPGMRYQYARKPDPQPWTNITIAIAGGLSVEDAIAGKCRSLQFEPVYTNHKASRTHYLINVTQQLGTLSGSMLLTYRVKFHRELPRDAVIQRWTLKIAPNGRRSCIPIMKNHGLTKRFGDGLLTYDLTWRRCVGGIQVAHFLGNHVNERLVIPQWLLDRRMCVSNAQKVCDAKANEFLESIGETPEAGKRQGVAALESYCDRVPESNRAANKLDSLLMMLARARKIEKKAIRTIEHLYEMVTHRVCELHGEIVADEIDLATIKRYDTRDLLKFDAIPKKSREYLQAVAPGKLKALLNGYGLARGEVTDEFRSPARETDIFSSFVDSLHRKTGPRRQLKCRRSQESALTAEISV